VDEAGESVSHFFDEGCHDRLKLLVSNLLEGDSLEVNDHPNLINKWDFGGRLTVVKTVSPSKFELFDKVLKNHMEFCLSSQLGHLCLAQMKVKDRSSRLVNFMEAIGEELLNMVG